MRVVHISAIVAVTTVVATLANAPSSAAQTEPSTLQCGSSVPIYRSNSGGALYHYQHLEPENGAFSFAPNPPIIGYDWHNGRALAAPGGVFYAAWNTGELRRYRRVNNAWETFPGGSQHQVIYPSGWSRYATAEYKNRITVDAEGHIYMIQPDGTLNWWAYNATAGTWQRRVIAGNWLQYNLIVAGGRGVIYGRLANGDLHRYRYHAASNRWLSREDIGKAWGRFDRVVSAGGDVLYGIEPDGDMFWYRWNENTGTWASQTGLSLGSGWVDWSTTAQPDACQRVGTSVPTRPVVPAQPNGAVNLLNSSDGNVHYGYVDAEGRATYAETADLSGGTPFGIAVVPGLQGVTATTALGEYQDGRVAILATGTDADVRESIRGTNDTWSAPTNEGGFVVTAPTVARLSGNVLAAYALDSENRLWERRQPLANTALGGWQLLGATPLAPGRLTIVPTATGVRIIGLGTNGRFQTTVYQDGTLATWSSLGGGTFTGTASAVTMPDGTVQVFAIDSAGVVQTQRQTSTGFPGAWTPLSGLNATGSASAIMAPDGTLQVVARGVDNYVYYAGQAAPGASTFNPWRTVTTSEGTSTDPTALAVPGQLTWVVGYINDTGVPKLRRYQPPVTQRSEQEMFVDVPMRFDS